MGKGLAALTFDEEYQKKRRLHMNKKPQTFSEGIARSGKSLVMVCIKLFYSKKKKKAKNKNGF